MDPEPVNFIWSLLFLTLSAVVIFCQYSIIETPDLSIKLGDLPSRKSFLLEQMLLSSRQFALTMRVAYSFFFACYSYAFIGALYSMPQIIQLRATMGVYDIVLSMALTVTTAVLQLVFGRGVPRRLALKSPLTVTLKVVPIAKAISVMFTPFAICIERVIGFVVMLCGGDFYETTDNVTEDEICMLVTAGEESGTIEQTEKEMIHNVFKLGDSDVSELMTHRIDVIFCSINSTLEEVIDLAVTHGFSRLPVTGDSTDDIVGVLNTKDLLSMVTGSDEGFTVKKYLRRPMFVPESTKCDDLFAQLNTEKMQLAIVVDEYGGTSGIISMEDIIESVFGDISDEYDKTDKDVKQLSANTFTLDGNLSLDEVEQQLDCVLSNHYEDEQFETIGGLMLAMLDRIPHPSENATVTVSDIIFTVIECNERQILKLRAQKPQQITVSQPE